MLTLIVLRDAPLPDIETGTPVSALNAVWCGKLRRGVNLPNIGHLLIVCPLDDGPIQCGSTTLDSGSYLQLSTPQPDTIRLSAPAQNPRVLVLMLSTGFVAEMADFLGIPPDMSDLLHGVPLLRGDMLSRSLAQMAASLDDPVTLEDGFMDVVGQLLRLMRTRHEALSALDGHRCTTLDDLVPRLLEARQFIESRFTEPIKTQHVADQVALSEYHFARLFKAAFDVTVHQFVVRLRLDHARHLLETGTSVTDTALDVGYNSLSAFIHAFRRTYTVTPSHYQAWFSGTN